jgi:hypothetical protein
MTNPCAATTKDGTPCRAFVLPGSVFCFSHDPEFAERRKQRNLNGGHGKGTKTRIRKGLGDDALTMIEVGGLLSRAILKLEAGTIEPGTATAMATVARAFAAIQEVGAIEARLTRLEQSRIPDIRSLNDRRSA